MRKSAEDILNNTATPLPNLSNHIILTPNQSIAQALRFQLLKQAQNHHKCDVLFGFTLCSLSQWLESLDNSTDKQLISDEHRLLILSDAVKTHNYLYGNSSHWMLAENLLLLFDELSLHFSEIPKTEHAFLEKLAAIYGISQLENKGLIHEAKLVHTLWQAWQQQLENDNKIDSTQHYIQILHHSSHYLDKTHQLYLIGFPKFKPVEQQWILNLQPQTNIKIIIHGDQNEEKPLQPKFGLCSNAAEANKKISFLNNCFDHNISPIKQRAKDFREAHIESPIKSNIKTLKLKTQEQQAQAVHLKIKIALEEGKQKIAIVTHNRLLARRIRALLERDQITMDDTSGWALSTTSAAAFLENWLQCIENNFPHQQFLELLKSPFTQQDDPEYLQNIYRLEQDIILHENVASGLKRYQKNLHYRAKRIGYWNQNTTIFLNELLDYYADTSNKLTIFVKKKKFDASQCITKLIETLKTLDIHHNFQEDAAGIKVLDALEKMLIAAKSEKNYINWFDFRSWLGRTLETHFFIPEVAGHSIALLNLNQSHTQHFETIIIASAEEKNFPGSPHSSPFFNDAVRNSLNLPIWQDHLSENQYYFRQLLEHSSDILITLQTEENAEPLTPCPWVEALSKFHQAVYNEDLEDLPLRNHLNKLSKCNINLNEKITSTQQPQPACPDKLLPKHISVSAHQRLIDCPYKFFVHDVLSLKPTDEVRAVLQKSDYGNRVHRCLEAFHADVQNLPGPFSEALSSDNIDNAIALLNQISEKVFNTDIEDNFQHRGWLQRWQAFIPHYLKWQLKHTETWLFTEAESTYEQQLSSNVILKGRLDRIDKNPNGINIIDYKTGGFAKLDDVLSGEDIQLSSYSLLLDHVVKVEYIGLDTNNRVNDKTVLENGDLDITREETKTRLLDIVSMLQRNHSMPAWSDETTCNRCDAQSICRKPFWSNENDLTIKKGQ